MLALKQPLSNVQLELLKLYATDLSEQDFSELRETLANFYAKKSVDAANKAWLQKGLTQADMDKWLDDEAQ